MPGLLDIPLFRPHFCVLKIVCQQNEVVFFCSADLRTAYGTCNLHVHLCDNVSV